MEVNLVGEAKELVKHYDLLSIVMVCLGGPDGENYDGILRMLDVLLDSETSEAEKRKILQDDYDIPMTQKMAEEVSVMCNLSEGVMAKGVAKGMKQGMAQGMAKGEAKGMRQGMEEGIAKGKKQGLEQGKTDTILLSLKSIMETLGLTLEQAMAALKVPEYDRQKYMELLKQQ